MSNETDPVSKDDKTPVKEDEKTQGQESGEVKEETSPEPATQKPPKGFVPYDALHSEREKRKLAEEELEKLKTSSPSEEEPADTNWEYLDDDEKKRRKEENGIKKDVAQLKEKMAWEDDFKRILKTYPQLTEDEEDFKEFAYKYPKSVDLEIIAKAYLFDKKPAEPEKEERKGLEKPTGGEGKVPETELSLGDITRMRKESPKEYAQAIREGRIKNIPEK